MVANRHEYVAKLREDSVYPGFRALIDMVATLMVCVAGLIFLVTLFGAIPQFGDGGALVLLFGFVQAAALYYASRLFRWVALMYADLLDSTLAHHAQESRAE